MTREDRNRLGFDLFTHGGSTIEEVQRIDDPKEWATDHGYDFEIPLLESDAKALEIAEECGYVFGTGVDSYTPLGHAND